MSEPTDRLYDLLPVIYRQRDAERGYPLRALLQVIAEQVDLVERDIAQLYENYFIETCDDWAVAYIGELIGYRLVHEAGEPGDLATAEGRARNKILIPRREVANTIRNRRRKGALALLEQIADDVAGWPARAVEFFTLLGMTQNLNFPHPSRGRTVDLRDGDTLDLFNTAFDEMAHTIEVRRLSSHRAPGRYNIPSVGLFVWRLRSYSATGTPAYCYQEGGPHRFTFSVLGVSGPLYVQPAPEAGDTAIATPLTLPVPIRRRAFERHTKDFYGRGKSLEIWISQPFWEGAAEARQVGDLKQYLVPAGRIVAADLSNWSYEPPRGKVAVDPVLGRLAFHPRQMEDLDEPDVYVAYHYGFSADVGGGEYTRLLHQPAGTSLVQAAEVDAEKAGDQSANGASGDQQSAQPEGQGQPGEAPLEPCVLYRVGGEGGFERIASALDRWNAEKPRHAIIEIQDNGEYVEPLNIKLGEGQTLQLRAANRRRPVLRLLDWRASHPEYLKVSGQAGSRLLLDGILITGRGLYVRGRLDEVAIRHTTLVPGWMLGHDCDPLHPTKPSLELYNARTRVIIDHSIIGSIQVSEDEVKQDPISIRISDSVVDATSRDEEAVGAPGDRFAHAKLTIVRSTVFGFIQTHAIALAENSIFDGQVRVARRQLGCMRFCYVPPHSRTPRRYNCQPDLVEQQVQADYKAGNLTDAERDSAIERERLRLRPAFNSTRYGAPTYCQLSDACATEISSGADDESEMGVFHDLFQPQRAANLRARLDEYSPAGMDAGVIYAS